MQAVFNIIAHTTGARTGHPYNRDVPYPVTLIPGDGIGPEVIDATIRSVDSDRYVWPHLLDEVTRALPPYTWLVDMGPARVAATTAPAPSAPAAASAGTKAAADTTGSKAPPPVQF